MNHLTRNEIDTLIERLSEWQTPCTMLAEVEAVVKTIGSSSLFNQSGLAFLRDAWIAGKIGEVRNAEKVRLVSDNWPDFELLIHSKVEAFEAVEADHPGRRRGVEYREGFDEVADDPLEDWIARADQAATWLQMACQKKVEKFYGHRVNLVIYLNLSEYGIRQSEVEACFPSATEIVKDAFETVWILWKQRAYRVWP